MIKTAFNLLLLLTTLLLFTSLSHAAPVEFQQWKQQVLGEVDTNSDLFSYHNFSQSTRDLMNQRNREAKDFMSRHTNDPVPLYILGWLGRQAIGFYYDDLQKVGKRYNRFAPESQKLIKEYQPYYQKAMELDDNPDAPNHLSVSMLSSIGMDSVGDPAIKVRALEKAAALARAGKNPGGSEMFEWNTYEARLGIYVDAKDYDNALKIVDEMIDRFGSNEELDGYKRHVEEVIAKRDNAAATVEDTYAQAEPYAEPIEEVVAEPQAVEPYAEAAEDVAETSKPAPVAKVAKPKLEPQADAQESNVMLWLLGGVALLGLIWFAFRRRKHSA